MGTTIYSRKKMFKTPRELINDLYYLVHRPTSLFDLYLCPYLYLSVYVYPHVCVCICIYMLF